MLMEFSCSGWHLTNSIFNHSASYCAVSGEYFRMRNCLWMACIWPWLAQGKVSQGQAQCWQICIVWQRKDKNGQPVAKVSGLGWAVIGGRFQRVADRCRMNGCLILNSICRVRVTTVVLIWRL